MVSECTVKDLCMHCLIFIKLQYMHICLSRPFVFFLQIRNDTSQIVNENLPQIQQKSDEMRQIYRRIDKLEVSDQFNFASLKGLMLLYTNYLVWCFVMHSWNQSRLQTTRIILKLRKTYDVMQCKQGLYAVFIDNVKYPLHKRRNQHWFSSAVCSCFEILIMFH